MVCIPNVLSSKFDTVDARKKIIAMFADSVNLFSGTNEDREMVTLTVSKCGLILTTYQTNGWVRINYYDEKGQVEGENFDGRWK